MLLIGLIKPIVGLLSASNAMIAIRNIVSCLIPNTLIMYFELPAALGIYVIVFS
jgi:hypothetical protein